jgi:hypothetical protein
MRPLLALVVLAGACADDTPADLAGVYTVNFTAAANGCNLDMWTEGQTTNGVELDLNQDPGSANVNGQVKGPVGLYIALIMGTNEFAGRVSGRSLDVILDRKYPPATQGQCVYNLQLHLTGTLAGEVLTGQLDITTTTNHSLDCGTKENCHSIDTFNGLRAASAR